MNMNSNNTGSMLKKALEKRQNGSLPSNFSFHMMEKIRIEAAKQEKKKHRMIIFYLILALMMILGVSIYSLFFYLDFKPEDFLPHVYLSSDFSSLLGFYTYIALLVLGLLGLDLWLRKRSSADK
ncbi:hypothetical protein H8744_10550 [Oscillospiraceae bacterium N12]|jgi:polyferredoxin|uniref:Uncharacterized protein n=2 Tax=Jilunia laotingensis TaxID=2763675 RepID=A0A926F450_9BACT|nr:hypothetical protein [Jilunia laotingensis]MBC8593675.1 hypothetical protein [Jilunia laotingensis]